MLKLEKISRSREIMVSLRDRDPRFNRTFIIAFAIAFSLHLLAGVLFTIRPFLLDSSELILPPIAASADLSVNRESMALAKVDKTERLHRTIPEPRYSVPKVPELTEVTVNRQKEYVMKKELTAAPFAMIEKEVFSPDFTAWESSKQHAPVQILVSGPLADKTIEVNGADSVELPLLNSDMRSNLIRALYAVEVENQSGQIFWYESQQKLENLEYRRLAEKILLNLRFHQDTKAFVTPGEIEIVFTFPEKSS